MGRVLAADPVIKESMGQDGSNRYAYVYNHPTAFIDPSGFEGDGGPDDEDPYTVVDVVWSSLATEFGPPTPIYLGQIEVQGDLSSTSYLGGNDGVVEGQAYGSNVGNQVGPDAVYADGFDSGDNSKASIELVAVRLPAPDPASSGGEGRNAASTGYLGLALLAVVQPEVGIPALAIAALSDLGVEGAVAIAEAGVVVEEAAPRIEEAAQLAAEGASQQIWAATEQAEALLQKGSVTIQELESFLASNGLSPSDARGFARSFSGEIAARMTSVGEQFYRYTGQAGTSGNFLSQLNYPSPAAAVNSLNLAPYNNPAGVQQLVFSNSPSLVFEGFVSGGAQGANQTLILDRSAFTFGLGVAF